MHRRTSISIHCCPPIIVHFIWTNQTNLNSNNSQLSYQHRFMRLYDCRFRLWNVETEWCIAAFSDFGNFFCTKINDYIYRKYETNFVKSCWCHARINASSIQNGTILLSFSSFIIDSEFENDSNTLTLPSSVTSIRNPNVFSNRLIASIPRFPEKQTDILNEK